MEKPNKIFEMKSIIQTIRHWRYRMLYRKLLMLYARKLEAAWCAKNEADSLFMIMTAMTQEEFEQWYYFSFRE